MPTITLSNPDIQIFDVIQRFDTGIVNYDSDGIPDNAVYEIKGKYTEKPDRFEVTYENGKEKTYTQIIFENDGSRTEINVDLKKMSKIITKKDAQLNVTAISETGISDKPEFITQSHKKENDISAQVQEIESLSSISNIEEEWKNFNIPYFLESKFHDNFHKTGKNIIHKYCETTANGLSKEEILGEFFDINKLTEQDIVNASAWLNSIRELINNIDKTFKQVTPIQAPQTYYKGIKTDIDDSGATFLNAQIGEVIIPYIDYTWFTPRRRIAEDYSNYGTEGQHSPEQSLVAIIKTPAGVRLSTNLNFIFEDSVDNINSYNTINVVAQRAIQYKVLNKEVKDERTYLTLQYIGQGKNPPSITPAETSVPSPAREDIN